MSDDQPQACHRCLALDAENAKLREQVRELQQRLFDAERQLQIARASMLHHTEAK